MIDPEAGSANENETNHFIVDWDGPDDLNNPKNWSFYKKWAVTGLASAYTFLSPFASAMSAPAASDIAEEFHIRSPVESVLTVSIFVLAYAFGPLLFAPLSEIYGRARLLQSTNLLFLAFNLGCGFAQNKSQLFVLRFMAGLGGGAPLAIGGGVISDVWNPEERGRALSLYLLAPVLGPVVGPLAGAWIAQGSDWRWIFWGSTIIGAAVQAAGIFLLDETYAPVLLERKAARVRKEHQRMDKTGATPVFKTTYSESNNSWKHLLQVRLIRPFVFFITEPVIQLFGLYLAFTYGVMYLFLTAIPSIFQDVYGFSVGIAGLHYIPLGIGMYGGAMILSRTMDRTYATLKEKAGGVGKPEFRLPSLVPGTILLPTGILITGWTAQARTHWICPDIGLVIAGAGILICSLATQSYVIDTYAIHSASALAAVGTLRSLAGFGFPLFAPAMYKSLGYGKGNTVLFSVAVAIGCPAPWLFWRYGKTVRGWSKYASKV
ncbi:MFS polyamine transporter [Thelephora terrestris]|uniref:MFS polyamine transporter n=1 Tax=Thelephora terrestris TaxID=56493 RepID=A0A9P6L7S1_9AGAM|nr:MFS polyamine transporter [Thelephora terrestris]